MTDKNFKILADELREKRETSDISLEYISQKTRIDLKFLKAIDSGNLHVIDEVYIRAFIREYAKLVGLDPEVIIKKYELAKQGKLDSELAKEEVEVETENIRNNKNAKLLYTSDDFNAKEPERNKDTSNRRLVYLISGASIIIISSLLVYFLTKEEPVIIKETPIEKLISTPSEKQAEERFEVKADTAETQPEIKLINGELLLNIRAKEKTWLRVLKDDNSTDEFILYPNSSKILRTKKEFNLLIGNAGGITLTLNNKLLDLKGNSGEIKNIQIDSSGIKYLKIEDRDLNGR